MLLLMLFKRTDTEAEVLADNATKAAAKQQLQSLEVLQEVDVTAQDQCTHNISEEEEEWEDHMEEGDLAHHK